MTHEQKPESPKFRAREAQIADLAFEISDWKSYDDNEDITIARVHIDEAEARGAAEQRKRAAIEDEAENARFADADEENTLNALMRRHGINREEASEELNWWQERDKRFPLNKAEQRRKDTEGALKEAAYALERVKDGERGGYNARNGKRVSVQMSDGERGDIIHSEVTEDCERALVTVRAAIREGGAP